MREKAALFKSDLSIPLSLDKRTSVPTTVLIVGGKDKGYSEPW